MPGGGVSDVIGAKPGVPRTDDAGTDMGEIGGGGGCIKGCLMDSIKDNDGVDPFPGDWMGGVADP